MLSGVFTHPLPIIQHAMTIVLNSVMLTVSNFILCVGPTIHVYTSNDLDIFQNVLQALLGNRYGYRPFPASIPISEFSMFLEVAASHRIDASRLSHWFQCDYNAVPPVYQLQPITTDFPNYTSKDPELRQRDRTGWWEIFSHIQSLFWQLVDIAMMEEKMTSERAHVYLQSGKHLFYCILIRL